MIKTLRTPDQAFNNLSDYPWEPNYIHLDEYGLRIHYLDEGPRDGEVLLLIHGIPTWSYLFRKMIPVLVANGYRVIVPDLIGFGKSDKPENRKDVTMDSVTDWFEAFFLQLNIKNISCFLNDFGGVVGLRMIAKHPHLFSRLTLANSHLPTGEEPLTPSFKTWKTFLRISPVVNIGNIIEMATINRIELSTVAAYNAPFPKEKYKRVMKKLPFLIPGNTENSDGIKNQNYWKKISALDIPVQTIFTDNDTISPCSAISLQNRFKGSKGQPHKTLTNTSHFFIEDYGETIAEYFLEFLRHNPI